MYQCDNTERLNPKLDPAMMSVESDFSMEEPPNFAEAKEDLANHTQ